MYQIRTTETPWGPVTSLTRTLDGAAIPFDPANTDYQAYLAWLSQGNSPLSTDSQEEIK